MPTAVKAKAYFSFTYTDTNRLGADGKTLADPSTTVDGDAGGSGTDLELGEIAARVCPKTTVSPKMSRLINTFATALPTPTTHPTPTTT